MINYALEEIHFEGCPGCSYAKGEFSLPCGMAYENERFTLSQDWELPIEGFFVVSPKRCVEKFSDLSCDEQHEMFDIVDKTDKNGVQRNILLVQGGIVTVLSLLFVVMPSVQSFYQILSQLTILLYLIMFMLMF